MSMLTHSKIDEKLPLRNKRYVMSTPGNPLIHAARWLLCSFVYLSAMGFSQTIDDVLSSVAMDEEGGVLSDDELFLLEELSRNPLDLNNFTRNELEAVPLLTSLDIALIMGRSGHLKKVTSVQEIIDMGGLSQTAELLLPIIATSIPQIPFNGSLRNRWVLSGDDQRVLTQLSFQQTAFKGGLLMERDPGEPSLADFLSGHAAFDLRQNLKLIAGDHRIYAGYGLLLGRSARPLKSTGNISSVARSGSGLRSFRSATEYWGLRGLAVRAETNLGSFTASLSSAPQDATFDSTGIISISTTGNHDSQTTLGRKHNAEEQLLAANWEIQNIHGGEIGIVATMWRWSTAGFGEELEPTTSAASFYSRWPVGATLFFGEVAGALTSSPAYLVGILVDNENIRWIGAARNYPLGFGGPRSQPFSEWSSSTLNELGLYQAVRLRRGELTFAAYGDIYQQGESSESGITPIRGYEMSASSDLRRGRNLFSLRWKEEQKSDGETLAFLGEPIPTGTRRESWRLKSTLKFGKNTKMQLQADQSATNSKDNSAYGYGISVKFHHRLNGNTILLHWAGFVIDDYNARIYVWDVNLPGEMRSQMFYGTGQSVGLIIKIKTRFGAALSFRVRSTWEFSRYTGVWSQPEVKSGFQMDIAF